MNYYLLVSILVTSMTIISPIRNKINNIDNPYTRIQSDSEAPHPVLKFTGMGDKEPILLVANKHSNTLSFINPFTFQIIETIPTGPNPHEITLTPDQKTAYLSSYEPPGNTISVIDLVNRKQMKEIFTGEYTRIHGAAMAPDGENAYFTAGQTGYIVEIDTRTNEITRAIPTHGKISHMVYVSPDNKTLFTGNLSSGNVSAIDRKSGELIKLIETGKGSGGMAFGPEGKTLWVLNDTDETIAIVDLSNYQVIETIPCPGSIRRIRFTEDGKKALITSWTKEGAVIVLDVASRKEIKRIPVCDFSIGVELSPNGKWAFIGCEDSTEKEILTKGNIPNELQAEVSNGVQVISMQDLSLISHIKTGLGPDPMVIWYPPSQ